MAIRRDSENYDPLFDVDKGELIKPPTDKYDKGEIEFGERHPALGPDYERAKRISERFMANFQEEQFNPLIEEFGKQFVDKMWGDISAWLIADTESNLQSEIRQMADASVLALLEGNKTLLDRYVLGDGFKPARVREKIFEQFKTDIITKGIKERDERIKHLEEALHYRS